MNEYTQMMDGMPPDAIAEAMEAAAMAQEAAAMAQGSPYGAMAGDPGMMEPEPPPPPQINAEEIVEQVRERFNRASDASDTIRQTWKKNYDAYNNQYDLGARLKWQASITLPLVSRSVLHKAAKIKSAMVGGTEDFYKIVATTPEGEAAIPIHTKLLNANLEAESLPEKLEPNIVAGELTSAVAFLAYPKPDGPWPGYSSIEPVDMRTLLRDHTGRGKFAVVVSAHDHADLMRTAQARGWDVEAAARLKGTDADRDPQIKESIERAARMVTMDTDDRRRRTVVLYEYWGPVHDNEGGEAYPFAYCVVGNGRELLHVEPDPYGDGKGPLVDGDILPNVFGVYAKSDVEDAREIGTFAIRLLNAMVDGASYDTMRAFLVDKDKLTTETLEELHGGLYPGFIGEQEGNPLKDPAIAPLNVGTMPPHLLALYQVARQEFEGGIEVTDLTRGTPAPQGTREQTAREFVGKQEAAGAGIDALTEAVEEKVLEPLLERLVYYQGRYCDLMDESVQRVAGEEIQEAARLLAESVIGPAPQMPQAPQTGDPETDEANGMMAAAQGQAMQAEYEAVMQQAMQSPEVLMKLQEAMAEPFSVSVRGIRGVLAQGDQLNKTAGFLQLATMAAQAPPFVDTEFVVRRGAHLNGMDPNDALRDDADQMFVQVAAQGMAQQMATQMVNEQMAMQGQGQGGNGSQPQRATGPNGGGGGKVGGGQKPPPAGR